MLKCIDGIESCVGRDYKELQNGSLVKVCCMVEITEEIELVQTIIDIIDDCLIDFDKLKRLSSKLTYATHTINKNSDDALVLMFNYINRFSNLIYEYHDRIISDSDICQLVKSFTKELKKWLQHKFLYLSEYGDIEMIEKSISADINTIEMLLGICMVESSESFDDDFDDMFF